MLLEDQKCTLSVEHHDGQMWLCVNDLMASEKLALFVSEDAVKAFTKAYGIHFTKGYTMGKMGI
jgi:hypothetical protein